MTKCYKLKKQWLGGEITLKADTKVWFEQDSEQWYMCFHEGRIKIVKYVLDEDMLPLFFEEIKEEQPFLWSDELVKEYGEWRYQIRENREDYPELWFKDLFEFFKNMHTKQQANTIPSVESGKSIKPPIGVVPEYILKQQRFDEVDEAIKRYRHSFKAVPRQLIDERDEITNWLQERNQKSQPKTERTYTEKELREAEERIWHIARDQVYLDRNSKNKQYRFLSYQQYKSSIEYYKKQNP